MLALLRRLHGIFLTPLLVAVLALAYVLSFAPVARFVVGANPWNAIGHHKSLWVALYEPALKLMQQRSLLRAPLLSWAEIWGVEKVAEHLAWRAEGFPMDDE